MTQVIRSLKSGLQVIALPWQELNPVQDGDAENARTDQIDISKYILEGSISKSLEAPAGSFSFTLPNTHDWKQILRPGTWCMIYLCNDGSLKYSTSESVEINGQNPVPGLAGKPDKAKLRCLGYIERVSVDYVSEPDSGARLVQYVVSGRDFGIVYEQTQIWLNFFKIESSLIKGLSTTLKVKELETLDKLLDAVHRLFLNPKSFNNLAAKRDITELGLQWLIPNSVFSLLDLRKEVATVGSYFGNIANLLRFEGTNYPISIINPLDNINGNLWERLKSLSQEQFHELFTELNDDGTPQLIFRPIPWATETGRKNYKALGAKIKTFSELASNALIVNQDDIYGYNLGEDTHARYNHFFTQIVNGVTPNSNIDILQNSPSTSGRKYPFLNRPSIARHGFRPMHTEINDLAVGRQKLLHEFNEILYDYWNRAWQYETGGVELIGRNDVRLGKALRFDRVVEYVGDKVFYIEGYNDNFSVEDSGVTTWTQNITLTRGIDFAKIKGGESLDRRSTPFENKDSFKDDDNV